MNNFCVDNMKQKKSTTKLVVLFGFLGLMMVFLVPILAEKAEGRTTAVATTNAFFSDIKSQLSAGKFLVWPIQPTPSTMTWVTAGGGHFGGDEEGFVSAKVGPYLVKLHFSNPSNGKNTCTVEAPSQLFATCGITQGTYSEAFYFVSLKGQENDSNYCNLINKFDSKQASDIKDKLNC
jgi:hypothetical protein